MSWRRRLAKMLELEPAIPGIPFTVEPDGSVLLHLSSKTIDLGRLPEGVVDQGLHDRPKVDAPAGSILRCLGGELHEIPSKCVLGGTGLTLLLAAFLLCHARQPIRLGWDREEAAA